MSSHSSRRSYGHEKKSDNYERERHERSRNSHYFEREERPSRSRDSHYFERGERSSRSRDSHYFERGERSSSSRDSRYFKREERSPKSRVSHHCDKYDKRDQLTFCTYMDNKFNKYMGKLVQLTIQGRHNKMHTYIGTFVAYDTYMNVILSDCYLVIRYHEEFTRQDVKGLLFVRGCHVLTVKRERDEKKLRCYPISSEGKEKAVKNHDGSSGSVSSTSEEPTSSLSDSANSRPIKLKRAWKNDPKLTPAPIPQKPQTVVSGAKAVVPASLSISVQVLNIKEEPQEEGLHDVLKIVDIKNEWN